MTRLNQLMPLCLVLSLMSTALGADPASKHWTVAEGSPPQLQAVIDARNDNNAMRRSQLLAAEDLEAAQAELREAKARGRSNTEAIEKATQKVAKAKARVSGLKSRKALPWPRFSTDELKVGTAGYWNCASVYKVFQIIDEKTAILQMQDSGFPLLWVENFDTTGMIDGKEIYATKLQLVVTGTKTYKTLAGSKTVFVARMFSDDDFVYQK